MTTIQAVDIFISLILSYMSGIAGRDRTLTEKLLHMNNIHQKPEDDVIDIAKSLDFVAWFWIVVTFGVLVALGLYVSVLCTILAMFAMAESVVWGAHATSNKIDIEWMRK